MVRMMVSLSVEEGQALARIAGQELRDPRDQIRLIIRKELSRQGLLAGEQSTGTEQPAGNGNGVHHEQ